jgi:hypothetical protein
MATTTLISKPIRAHIQAQATKSLLAMQARVAELDAVLQAQFGAGHEEAPLSTSVDQFLHAQQTNAGSSNAKMCSLIKLAFDECNFALHHLWVVERWVQLQMPFRESGDNFGVEVVQDVIKVVQDRNMLMVNLMDQLPAYHLNRATVLEKMMPEVKKTSVVSRKQVSTKKRGSADDIASEDEDATNKKKKPKTSTADEQEEVVTAENDEKTVTQNKDLDDFRLYIASHDTKWLWSVKDILRNAQDSYLLVLDIVEKNREKIDKPKSASAHNHHFS